MQPRMGMSLESLDSILVLPAATAAQRARLARVVDGSHRLENLASLRSALVALLAALSAPLWLHAAFPHVAHGAARWSIAAWVAAVLGLAAVSLVMHRARRRLPEAGVLQPKTGDTPPVSPGRAWHERCSGNTSPCRSSSSSDSSSPSR